MSRCPTTPSGQHTASRPGVDTSKADQTQLPNGRGSHDTQAGIDDPHVPPSEDAPSCPFDRLAAVECQLILQLLDNTSRLVASRCSRTLRAEASHPFSWRYAEPVTLLSSEVEERLPLVESSPLRLAPVHMCVDTTLQSAADVTVPTIPRLHGLEFVNYFAFTSVVDPTSAWAELLSHPSMQQLRTLHCPFDHDMSWHMPLIAQLPHLTSLAFCVDSRISDSEMALLSTAPASLTSVRCNFVSAFPSDVGVATLQALTRMPQLRRLWLASPPFTASAEGELHCTSLRSFLTSPGLSRLTHLTLEEMAMTASSGVGPTPPTPEDCATAFGALTHLTHLGLKVYGVDLLLLSVVHARGLEHLRVYVEEKSTHPSADVLRPLLDSMPQLQVRLTPLNFLTADAWPAYAACAELPRVIVTPSIIHVDVNQDE